MNGNALNLMIARGWEPTADIASAKRNALGNMALEQQVQAQPQMIKMREQEMQLRELALDIKAQALQSGPQQGEISLDYPFGTITGPQDKIVMAADALAQHPNQAQDPNFMPWLARQGIKFKQKEQKASGPEVGKTRSFSRGGSDVTQEWTGSEWKDLATGPRWNPDRAGMKVYDSQGNLIVDTGGGGPVSKPTQTKMETEILSGKEQLARMEAIERDFKPEYMETGTRLSAAWTGVKARLGKGVPQEDAKSLGEFKKFQRKAIENINKYIKELTGAQMSEKEADRIRLAQPDPGENWWQGDDPITFKSKMDDVIKASRASVARWEYYKAKGLSDAEIKGVIKTDSGVALEKLISAME